MVEVYLDHHGAENLLAVANRRREEVAAFTRGGAQPEEMPGAALHGFAKVGAIGKVTAYKRIFLRPVRGRQGGAVCGHQIDDIGPGLLANLAQQVVGCGASRRLIGVLQGATHVGQVRENGR